MKDFNDFLASEEFEKFSTTFNEIDMPHIIEFSADLPSLIAAVQELNRVTGDKYYHLFIELLEAYHNWLNKE